MSWESKFHEFLVFSLIVVGLYAVSGRILRSTHPGGTLSWCGQRWRIGFTFTAILFLLGFEISSLSKLLSLWITGVAWIGLGFVILLVTRWCWRDWEKEKVARRAFVEKLHREGRELILPQMSSGQKAWNWVLIVYGAAGLLGGLYEVILHLIRKR